MEIRKQVVGKDRKMIKNDKIIKNKNVLRPVLYQLFSLLSHSLKPYKHYFANYYYRRHFLGKKGRCTVLATSYLK